MKTDQEHKAKIMEALKSLQGALYDAMAFGLLVEVDVSTAPVSFDIGHEGPPKKLLPSISVRVLREL